MATQILNTRIKNRLDTLTNWQADGVELLKGEIALVSVTTQQKDEKGNIVDVPAVLMKVGEEGKTFNQLPWLSAKAADVYDWAKVQYAANIPVTFNEDGTVKENLNDYLTKVNNQATDLANIKAIFNVIDNGTGSFITDITYDDNGNFALTRSNVNTNDIVEKAVTEDKIGDSAITSPKIATAAVYDVHIVDVDAYKVMYPAPDAGAMTLPEKIGEIDTQISILNSAVEGGVHFIGTTHKAPYTKTEDGVSYAFVELDDGLETVAKAGDVVIYSGTESIDTDGDSATGAESNTFEKEYISTGDAWQEIGDLSRVGKLETWRKGLDYTTTNAVTSTHKFASQVTQTDGKITVTYTQPTAEDIKSGSETVAAAIARHESQLDDVKINGASVSVPDYIADVLNDLEFAASQTTDGGSGANFTFITEVTQTDGKIAAKKATIQDADTSKKGIVQLSSATDSDSEALAATPKAVKAVATTAADALTRISTLEGDYIKYNSATKHAYVGKNGDDGEKVNTDYIIFDCGNASGWDN